MKKAAVVLMGALMASLAQANDVQLIVQKVDNQGLVPGNTYRVYAVLPEGFPTVHAVWGDTENPLMIESTAPFYNHPFGGNSTLNISDAALALSPELAYDTWITLGYENGEGNDMWDLGVDFTDFETGGTIMVNNGAWFLLPTDEKCAPNELGLVLLGQFTTTGTASGTLNLQGWTEPQVGWQRTGLTFTTENAQIFGCTDSAASNFNAQATFDDNSCEGTTNNNNDNIFQQGHGTASAIKTDNNSWDIFPNPIRENLFHVQFKNNIDFSKGDVIVDIFDASGRKAHSLQVNEGMMIGGNRLMLTPALSGGTYKVVLTAEGKQESKSLIVQK
ncbi:MAG: hypothetical protein RL220_1067 [Bacteroidota bacterium]|jgi:hypothetical protein